MFNFNKAKNKGEQASESTANDPWETTKNVAFRGKQIQVPDEHKPENIAKGANDFMEDRKRMEAELRAQLQALAKSSNTMNKGQ